MQPTFDGTTYTLASATNGAPDAAEVDGAAVPACAEGAANLPFFLANPAARRFEVRGGARDVRFLAGDTEVARLRSTGALAVEGVVLRY